MEKGKIVVTTIFCYHDECGDERREEFSFSTDMKYLQAKKDLIRRFKEYLGKEVKLAKRKITLKQAYEEMNKKMQMVHLTKAFESILRSLQHSTKWDLELDYKVNEILGNDFWFEFNIYNKEGKKIVLRTISDNDGQVEKFGDLIEANIKPSKNKKR